MTDDGKNFCYGALAAGVALALIISAVAWPVTHYYTNVTLEMMRQGYEQQVTQSGFKIWVKSAKSEK